MPNVRLAQKSFWMHPMQLLGDVDLAESCFFRLETVLVSVKDGCMFCTRHTIGSEIILDAPDGTTSMERLADVGHLDSRFFLFGDSVSVSAR